MRKLMLLAIATGVSVSGCSTVGGHGPMPEYRDLNHNAALDPYEDPRLTDEERVEDLLAHMTVEEKIGALLHGTLPAVGNPFGASDQGYDLDAIDGLLKTRGITSMISRLTMPPADFAAQNNAVQRLAENTRLGIPVTISTDPRNHFSTVAGASNASAGFSQWPEPLGLAAIGDPALVQRFAATARKEYRAVGLHMALSPQADLATEPRWPRGIATFGSDPRIVSQLAGAYVVGFQGSATGLTRDGVATVAKHWLGYGAQPEGFDAHNWYGKRVTLTNESLARHRAGFDGVLAANTAGIMPTYAIIDGVTIDGKPIEAVGAGFSKELLSDMLRRDANYGGLVVSDWGIANDCPEACRAPTSENPQGVQAIGMPWGVEDLTMEDRVAKAVNAGVDQFGGLDDPAALLAALRSGRIDMARIDQSVRRVMLVKFRLGLFDDPYVDPEAAGMIVGNSNALAQGNQAQARALVLLQDRDGILRNAREKQRVWLYGIDLEIAQANGFEVVRDPAEADMAILRFAAPAEKLHPHHFFGAMQNEGRLDFRPGDAGYDALLTVDRKTPTIIMVDLDRPAVLSEVLRHTDVLIGAFGASDGALFDVLTGKVAPQGRLPVELPRDMDAVVQQRPDLSEDSVRTSFPRGFGLR
ncbi:glycoside hydrolase family 3 N-terminal domain-containing protein [uncultured Croceicoccus sp.]|uniref:glycoside hydrolase family 3 protein n=1 Tax=uncultured Croceicoccus sp. TaxID=1295329 RepID=UPI0026144ACC|nr:glycoside hydrolase family 3 N-terminal domain-containing protein [uncultured Croceicoccus sp.]